MSAYRVGYIRNKLDLYFGSIADPQIVDPVCASFKEAVCSVLRWHSAALQNLVQSIQKRQIEENGKFSGVSFIEMVLHTEKIRKQIFALASFCEMDALGNFQMEFVGHQLLSKLFTELLEADNSSSPLLRFLFCSSFQPFHQEIRKWLYSTERVTLSSYQLPEFMESVEGIFTEAGQQLRVLSRLSTDLKIEERLIWSIHQISKSELSEMINICQELDTAWANCESTIGYIELNRWHGMLMEEQIPLPFRHDTLQKVIETIYQASKARFQETQHLLNMSKRIKQLESEIENSKVLEQYKMKVARIERQRHKSVTQALTHGHTIKRMRNRQREAIKKANRALEEELRVEMEIDEGGDEMLLDEETAIVKPMHRATWDTTEIASLEALDLEEDEKSEMTISENENLPTPEENETSALSGVEDDGKSMFKVFDVNEEGLSVPVSAVMDGCILQPIIEQHRCISFAFSAIFCNELGFLEIVASLRRFFFSESADWIASLTDHMLRPLTKGHHLTNHVLNEALEGAFLDSIYHQRIDEKEKLRLHFIVANEEKSTHSDASSQECANCVMLCGDVGWPISLVVENTTFRDYNLVFQMLLKVHQAQWWLRQIWNPLHKTKFIMNQHRSSPESICRIKKLRLWYQDALNMATTLQSYMHQELHSTQWQEFMDKMKRPGLSLMKIKDAQNQYISKALEICFLSNTTRRLKSMVESALQSIINFCSVVKTVSDKEESYENMLFSLVCEEAHWSELEKLSVELRHRSTAFYKTLKYRANRGECTEGLLIRMTFNHYYGPAH